jgi:hypothetical protein
MRDEQAKKARYKKREFRQNLDFKRIKISNKLTNQMQQFYKFIT